MDILNTREWALVIWSSVTIFYVAISPRAIDIRKALGKVIRGFLAFNLVFVYCFVLFYLITVIFFLDYLGLWESQQLKNTIVWFFTFGIFSIFQINKIKEDNDFFKRAIFNNLKLIAVIQFFVGIYTFNLITELILLPILFFIAALTAFSKRDKKFVQVHNLLNGILSFFGFLLIAYFVYGLVTNFDEFAKEKTVFDFFIPVILTILYTPFLFFLLLYSVYEATYVRLKYFIKNKWMRLFFKILAIIVFNFRLEMLERWVSSLVYVRTESFRSVLYSMYEVFKLRKAESVIRDVPKSEGWNPYKAKDFLSEENLKTGYYHRSFDEWFASSEMVEFGDCLTPCNVSYYVKGTESAAKTLKLNINVNNQSMENIALEKLLKLIIVLFEKALDEDIPDRILGYIVKGEQMPIYYKGKHLSFIKNYWSENKLGGFDIKFKISIAE